MAQKDKDNRWENGRAIITNMLPTLPSASYAAVVMYCWFQASGKDTRFDESCGQIGKACKLSERQVRRIMSDLERAGCVETISKGCGMRASTRRLIRRKYTNHPEV